MYGFLLPWFCGGIWSDFKFISYVSLALNIYIVLIILLTDYRFLTSLKISLWTLFLLAMYIIWLEPWITILTSQSPEVLLSFTPVGGILFITDSIFSSIWFVLTWAIHGLLDKEF